MNKKTNTRLKMYAAVACVAAATGTADAQVIYTDLNPDTVLNYFESYPLDIDNNGQPEMSLEVDIVWAWSGYVRFVTAAVSPVNAVIGSMSSLWANTPLPYALNNGDSISGTTPGWQYGSIFRQYLAVDNSPVTGNWGGLSDKFLGIKFKIGTNTHYGWARLSLDAAISMLTIKDYAYQATPDLGIVAGENPLGITAPVVSESITMYASAGHVVINSDTVHSDGIVRITNTLGQLVREMPLNTTALRISLEENPHGIYFVEVIADNKKYVKKVYIF